MLHHPAWSTIFHREAPNVKLLDLRATVNSVSTHTFTGVSLGYMGPSFTGSGEVYGTDPHIRSSGRKAIAVVIHGEDAATTFNVSSVTIDGVAGTEIVDRGGGTAAINSAIYYWDMASLADITGTDVVVNWSEAVTTAAIGVLLVENLGVLDTFASGANRGTAGIDISPTVGTDPTFDTNALCIMAATCAATTETYAVRCGYGGVSPTILYDDANAAMSYAAAWFYVPQHCFTNNTTVLANTTSWSGAGEGDAVCAGFV